MAERYEDFDRNRDRDAGRRFDDYRRESRSEDYEKGGSGYDRYGRERDYDREHRGWGGREGYRSESRHGGGYGTETSEFGQRDSGQDWRAERQGSYGGGMGEGFGREREGWQGDRGYGERGGYRGGEHGQGGWGGGTYGSETYRGGGYTAQGAYGTQGTIGRFTGRGPKGYRRSDDRIREDACERLTQHPDIDASEIDIQIRNGEITLTGSVEDRRQKRTAEDIVENLSGVREVHNQLRISKGLGQRMGEALGLSGERQPEEGRRSETSTTGRQYEPAGSRR